MEELSKLTEDELIEKVEDNLFWLFEIATDTEQEIFNELFYRFKKMNEYLKMEGK